MANNTNKKEISLESEVLVTYDCSVKGFKYEMIKDDEKKYNINCN